VLFINGISEQAASLILVTINFIPMIIDKLLIYWMRQFAMPIKLMDNDWWMFCLGYFMWFSANIASAI